MDDVRFNKLLLAINALIPLVLLAIDGYRGRLGANPIEFFLRSTGVLALIFLLLTLTVTPLRRAFGWNGLIKYRRMLGLFAFFYAAIHLTTYSVFDKGLDLSVVAKDVLQRPFIAIGMLAFAILIPLAITSTNGMVKRLGGKRWARLHRITYVAGGLGVIHFWLIVKSDIFFPAIFAGILLLLLLYRLVTSKALGLRMGTSRTSPSQQSRN